MIVYCEHKEVDRARATHLHELQLQFFNHTYRTRYKNVYSRSLQNEKLLDYPTDLSRGTARGMDLCVHTLYSIFLSIHNNIPI